MRGNFLQHGHYGHFGPHLPHGRHREELGQDNCSGRHQAHHPQEGHHMRGRWPHGPRGHNWGGFFGGGEGNEQWGGFGGPGGPGGPGGRPRGRDRMERGMLRYIILGVLQSGPKHGYEIIKHFEEHTGGQYAPSPGTLYPTLQFMEDLGLVRSDQEADKRVYHLTEAGEAELKEHLSRSQGFWARYKEHVPSGPIMSELNFVRDAVNDLTRTVGGGIRTAAFSGDTETVRKIRLVLERCQNEVREIIARGTEAGSTPQANGDITQPEESKGVSSGSGDETIQM
ncbi:MAG: PadR family transcriptional regulator [Chloroflexota bacterium]|nr:PadR family transcriptional regulator [Chloroflexota bacterium]